MLQIADLCNFRSAYDHKNNKYHNALRNEKSHKHGGLS